MPADQITAWLWPGRDPSRQTSNLSTATYDARRALGSEAWRLQRRGKSLWLDRDGADIDLDAALACLDRGATDEAADAARAALGRGILPALAHEPWVRAANTRLTSRFGVHVRVGAAAR